MKSWPAAVIFGQRLVRSDAMKERGLRSSCPPWVDARGAHVCSRRRRPLVSELLCGSAVRGNRSASAPFGVCADDRGGRASGTVRISNDPLTGWPR